MRTKKSASAFPGRVPAETVAREKQSRFNPIRGLDPDRLVDAICAYNAGELAPMARIIEAFEQRDDTMTTASRKMRASVVRCPHQVLVAEGVSEKDRERAQRHKAALERFWARVRTTSLFARNSRGGFQMLLKQMMAAQSYGFAVHEIVWRPRPDGEVEAQFVAVPLQFFENTTGELRFRREPASMVDGEPMSDGEWLVTSGDGIGIAASVAAMGKRLSFQDWLLFSERCGQPGLHAKTGAKKGSEEWNNLVAAVANFGREWSIVTDMSTDVDSVSLANGGPLPFPELVRLMNQAISALYRGNDLSTISGASGDVGASLQGEETDLLEQAACETLSETLQEQVERHVIAYEFGDEEPLAYVQISPRAVPDVDKEIKVDQHLVSLGVPLSRNDALERYGRAMADPADGNDAALKQAQPPAGGAGGGFGAPGGGFGLPNEAPAPQDRENAIAKPLQNARSAPDGKSPVPTPAPALKRVLEAFRSDLGPAAEELRKVLALPEAEMRAACKDLAGRLPDLLPAEPAMAAILAEALAGAFAEAVGEVSHEDTKARSEEALANEVAECRAKDPAHCPVHGTPREHRDKGFQDRYGNGNPEFLVANPEMNIERGKAVFTRLARKQTGFEPHAMYREGLGWVGVDAGEAGNPRPYDGPNKDLKGRTYLGGHGIAHILAKHPGAEKDLAETIQHGEMFRNFDNATKRPNERKLTLIRGNNVVILSKHRDGRLLITEFFADDPAKIEALKVLGPYHVRGENK